MSVLPIGELVEPIRTWNPSRSPEVVFEYVDLSAVSSDAKRITTTTSVAGAEAPSRARQLIAAGDVLVSTVRPNLNAVAYVTHDFDGSTASTGFTVLRPGPRLDGCFLFHWVRSNDFISDMVRKATGASYPAVSDRIVKESRIPAPKMDEQRRIAAILDHADGLRAKRRQLRARLDALTQSIFHDMFGDPDTAIDTVPFGEVAGLSGGRNLVADDSSAATSFRVLKISAVTSGVFKPCESKPLPAGYEPPHAHLIRPGDLLMSRANTAALVGAVAYVHRTPPNLALPDKVWRFVWRDEASVPMFYHSLLQTKSVRRRISQLASGTGGSMKNVSKAKLETMPLPFVPPDQQQRFATIIGDVAAQIELVTHALGSDDELYASLQSRAFKGEL